VGDEVDGLGVRLPLSSADRNRIIEAIEALPSRQKGGRVHTLVAWVERALLATGVHESLADFDPGVAAYDAAVGRLHSGVIDLMSAAKAMRPDVPPVDGRASWVDAEPYRRTFDALASAIAEAFPAASQAEQRDAEKLIATAVLRLSCLGSPSPLPGADTCPVVDDNAERLISAVIYYRWQEKLPITNVFVNANNESRQKGKHRSDDQLIPSSDTAQLIESVLSHFGFKIRTKVMRTMMTKYIYRYKGYSVGAPSFSDSSLDIGIGSL
jgi:hypothetical protein